MTLPDLLAATGVREAVLIGHSDGASIALLHAGLAPRRSACAAVVSMAAHVIYEPISLASMRKAKHDYATTNLRAKLARHHDDVDGAFRGWADLWDDKALLSWSIVDCLPGIAVPLAGDPGHQGRIRHAAPGRFDLERRVGSGRAPGARVRPRAARGEARRSCSTRSCGWCRAPSPRLATLSRRLRPSVALEQHRRHRDGAGHRLVEERQPVIGTAQRQHIEQRQIVLRRRHGEPRIRAQRLVGLGVARSFAFDAALIAASKLTAQSSAPGRRGGNSADCGRCCRCPSPAHPRRAAAPDVAPDRRGTRPGCPVSRLS